MRTIKFRAWDGEQMVWPDRIDSKGVAWWKENSIPTTSTAVMQFTGCFDHKNKEIYEGDILRANDKTWSVIFSGGGFVARNSYMWKPIPMLWQPEVIGNIHQRPKGEKNV